MNGREHWVAVGIAVMVRVAVTVVGAVVGMNVAVDVAEEMPVGVAGTRVVVMVGDVVGDVGVFVRVPVGAGDDAVGMAEAVGMTGVGVTHTSCPSLTVSLYLTQVWLGLMPLTTTS